jgi:RNA polymerase sigma-70 factor, ECF subfamily
MDALVSGPSSVGRRESRPVARDGQSADPDLAAVRAAQSDRGAFEVLYRRYLDRVYAYAFYQLGDHHDAEDATERTFLAALRGISTFEDQGSSFRAWLFRIAHNTVLNARRTKVRRRAEPLPDAWDPAADDDPAGAVTRAEELRAVLQAVRDLPADRRQVVLLRFVDGLSSAEIGAAMGRSRGAVRVLLHRALKEVAASLR